MSTNRCVFCQMKSQCLCERCGDFYCSLDCQRKDWQRHRYICMPLPALIHSSEFFDPKLLELSQPQSKANQKLPQNIKLTEKTHEASPILRKLQNSVNKRGDEKPAAEQICLYQQLQHQVSASTGPIPAKFPRGNSHVVVCGFRSPNRCYVRELNPSLNASYAEMLKMINNCGKSTKLLSEIPIVNSYALHKTDDIMHRVQIISVRPKACRVLFIDIGTIAVRHWRCLYEISSKLQMLPQYITLVQLKNVKNYAIDDTLQEYLAKYEGIECRIVYDETGFAELYDCETNKSVNEVVNNFCAKMTVYKTINDTDLVEQQRSLPDVAGSITDGTKDHESAQKKPADIHNEVMDETLVEKHAVAVSQASKQSTSKSLMIINCEMALKKIAQPQEKGKLSPMLSPPFQMQHLPISDNQFEVFIVDTSKLAHGFIGCLSIRGAAELKRTENYLTNFNDSVPYTPILNEYVIAKNRQFWRRGKVLEVKDNAFTILFIDFTSEATLSIENIRRYPADLTYDCHTNFCQFAGLPSPLDDCHKKLLNERIELYSTIYLNGVSYPNEDLALVKCDTLLDYFNNGLKKD